MIPNPTRAEINRANSQQSTGPKTAEGKNRSSLNSLRHGLTGQRVVMPDEDLDAYQHHLKSFTDEYQPEGPTESHLVQLLTDTSWRLNRIVALETSILTEGGDFEKQSKSLATLSLYTQRLSRQFEKTQAHLRELQTIRQSRQETELDDLLDIMEMYESKGELYTPSEDGFVFSQSQIDAAILARNRKNLALEAFEYTPTSTEA
jgi:hypothetical protein